MICVYDSGKETEDRYTIVKYNEFADYSCITTQATLDAHNPDYKIITGFYECDDELIIANLNDNLQ